MHKRNWLITPNLYAAQVFPPGTLNSSYQPLLAPVYDPPQHRGQQKMTTAVLRNAVLPDTSRQTNSGQLLVPGISQTQYGA